MPDTIQLSLFDYFMEDEQFTVKEATNLIKNVEQMQVNDESIRARIYEGVDKGIFKKISRGVYKVESQIGGVKTTCVLVNGNGRDLSMINDKSIDGIITDHPYDLSKQLDGGNRKFAKYERFKYNKKDFQEKQRVLKDGAFLVEFLPEENAENYEYLHEIKEMAKECGFQYFAKVPWVKGNFVANTGRKSKNTEDVMIFSNGEPRNLKLYAKKNLDTAKANDLDYKGLSSEQVKELLEQHNLPVAYMSGTNGMLPTAFNYQPKNSKDKVMEAEKPVDLLKEIVGYISKPYETLLDQFAGSGNLGIAGIQMQRNIILYEGIDDELTAIPEKQKESLERFNKMKNHIETETGRKAIEIQNEEREIFDMRKLCDLVTIEQNDMDQVLLKVKPNGKMDLIKLGFDGDEELFRYTKGSNHRMTFFRKDGKSTTVEFGSLGATVMSEHLSQMRFKVKDCIEQDFDIYCGGDRKKRENDLRIKKLEDADGKCDSFNFQYSGSGDSGVSIHKNGEHVCFKPNLNEAYKFLDEANYHYNKEKIQLDSRCWGTADNVTFSETIPCVKQYLTKEQKMEQAQQFKTEYISRNKIHLSEYLEGLDFNGYRIKDENNNSEYSYKLIDTTGANWKNIQDEIFNGKEDLIDSLSSYHKDYYQDPLIDYLSEKGIDTDDLSLNEMVNKLFEFNDQNACDRCEMAIATCYPNMLIDDLPNQGEFEKENTKTKTFE